MQSDPLHTLDSSNLRKWVRKLEKQEEIDLTHSDVCLVCDPCRHLVTYPVYRYLNSVKNVQEPIS